MYQSFREIQHVRPERWHLLHELYGVASQTRVTNIDRDLAEDPSVFTLVSTY